MEIRITDMSVKDAANILTDLASIMECSAERGDIPAEMYASAFEVMGALASAIKQQTDVS